MASASMYRSKFLLFAISNCIYLLVLVNWMLSATNRTQVNSTLITDLQGTTPTDISSEAATWIPKRSTIKTFTCGTVNLLQGYAASYTSIWVEKSYSIGSSHTTVTVIYDYWLIGTWGTGNSLTTYVKDGSTMVYNDINIKSLSTSWTTTVNCGGSVPSALSGTSYLKMAHSSSTLVLGFYQAIGDTGIIGIKNVRLIFNSDTISATSVCGLTSPAGLLESPVTNCVCLGGSTFNQATGNCDISSCDVACNGCSGSGPTQCTVCATNYHNDGYQCCSSNCATCITTSTNICASCIGGQFLYWDSSCRSSCTPPLSITTPTGGGQGCYSPCATSQFLHWSGNCINSCSSILATVPVLDKYLCLFPCNTNEYLYWNGSCLSTCAAPLTPRVEFGELFCDYLCAASQYLYWNRSCISTCNAPLSIRVDAGDQYCDYPCYPGKYLYWNGSCISTCNAPLSIRIDAGDQYCDYPCYPGKYLYWNGSCISTCNSPLSIRIDAGDQYCDYPCYPGKYLYWNGSCINTCNAPLSIRVDAGDQYCDYPCYPGKYLYWNGSCISTCNAPLSIRIDAGDQYCDYPCYPGKYLYWNGSCISTCNTPLSIRIDAGDQYCDYPCYPGKHLYWNGSCINACNAPLSIRIDAGDQYCDYPCYPGKYLYWNGSCISLCSAPLSIRVDAGDQYCDYPCYSGKHLYWNGSCINACSAPLSIRIDAGDQYCDYPCSNSQYLYQNSSCLSICSSPFNARLEAGNKYCDQPCSGTEYFYENSSCLSNCSLPWLSINYGLVQLCNKPCTTSPNLYYDLDTQGCRPECKFPYVSDQEDFGVTCYLSMKENDIAEVTDIVKTTSDAATAAKTGLAIINLFSATNPSAVTSGSLIKLLEYTRYINLTHSPRLELTYSLYRPDMGLFSIQKLQLSSGAVESLTKQAAPFVFEKYKNNLKSSFIVSFWDGIVSLLIILAAVFLLYFMDWFTAEVRSRHKFCLYFLKIKIIAQNFLVGQFFDSFSDIILLSILELRSGQFNTFSHVLSLLTAITFVLMTITLLFICCRLVISIQRIKSSSKNDKEELEQYTKNYKGIGVVYEDFKNTTFSRQAALLFIGVRSIAFALAIGLLYEHPMVQSLFYLLSAISMLLYLLALRPFESLIDLVQQICFEVILFSASISLVGMAVMDVRSQSSDVLRNDLGEVIIKGSLIASFLGLVFQSIKGFIVASDLYIYIRNYKRRRLVHAIGGHPSNHLNQEQINNTISTDKQISNENRLDYSMKQSQSTILINTGDTERALFGGNNTILTANDMSISSLEPISKRRQTFLLKSGPVNNYPEQIKEIRYEGDTSNSEINMSSLLKFESPGKRRKTEHESPESKLSNEVSQDQQESPVLIPSMRSNKVSNLRQSILKSFSDPLEIQNMVLREDFSPMQLPEPSERTKSQFEIYNIATPIWGKLENEIAQHRDLPNMENEAKITQSGDTQSLNSSTNIIKTQLSLKIKDEGDAVSVQKTMMTKNINRKDE